MADDSSKPADPARGGRNRRQPPTLELTATEVASDAATGGDPATSAEAASAGAPPEDTPSEPAGADENDTERLAPPPQAPVRPWIALLAGACGGAAVCIGAGLVAWYSLGVGEQSATVNRQVRRLAAVEATVHELATRRPPAGVDRASLEALAKRLAALESGVAANGKPTADANSGTATKLSELEKGIISLRDQIAALDQRTGQAIATAEAAQGQAETAAASAQATQSSQSQGDNGLRQQVYGLSDRTAALEQGLQRLQAASAEQQAELAQPSPTNVQRPIRLAVVAESLKVAVAGGGRFRTELDAAKALAPDAARLAPLESFADGGIPSAAALGQQIRAVLPAMREVAAPEGGEDEGFFKRLQANAERLVRIHPIDEQAGDDPGAILTRVEARATRGDVGGTLAELDKLPPAVREPAEPWIKRARARDAAIDASEQFAASAIGALAHQEK